MRKKDSESINFNPQEEDDKQIDSPLSGRSFIDNLDKRNHNSIDVEPIGTIPQVDMSALDENRIFDFSDQLNKICE